MFNVVVVAAVVAVAVAFAVVVAVLGNATLHSIKLLSVFKRKENCS